MYVAIYKSSIHIGTEILSSEWKGHNSTLNELFSISNPRPENFRRAHCAGAIKTFKKQPTESRKTVAQAAAPAAAAAPAVAPSMNPRSNLSRSISSTWVSTKGGGGFSRRHTYVAWLAC